MARTAFTRLLPIMALMGLFLVLVQINRQSGGVLAIYFSDIRQLSAAQIGGITGVMYLGSTLAQIPLGILFDRFGTRLTLATLGAIAVLGILLFAGGEDVWVLAAGRFLIGLGHAGVITGVYLLAVAWTSHERMASVSSLVIGIGGGIGGLLATAPLALMLSHYGLQVTFTAVALITALITVVLYRYINDAPPEHSRPAGRAESLVESLSGVWTILRQPDMHRLIAMGFCFSAPFSTIGGLWAGPYLYDIHGLSQQQASYVLLAMIIAFHAGTIAYGPLDRVFNTRKWVVLGGVALMVLDLLLLIVYAATALWLAVLLLILFSLFTPFYATLIAHSRGFIPAQMMGRAITVISLSGLGGVFLMQSGTGLVMTALAMENGSGSLSGYRVVFALIAAALLVSGCYYATVRDIPARSP